MEERKVEKHTSNQAHKELFTFGHNICSSKTSFVNYMFWIKILQKDYAPQSATEQISERRTSVVQATHSDTGQTLRSITFLLAELLSSISKPLEKEGLRRGVDNIL